MGPSEIGVMSGILFKLLDHFGYKYLPNRHKAEKYIAECLEHAEAIIESKHFPNDKADYSHQVVKKLYVGASESVGDLVSANNLEKIMQALSAARIYYWVRHFDGKPSEEIVDLINDRIKRIKHGSVRHHSFECVIKGIKDASRTKPGMESHELQSLKENCLVDIAELKKLALNVSIAKARNP